MISVCVLRLRIITGSTYIRNVGEFHTFVAFSFSLTRKQENSVKNASPLFSRTVTHIPDECRHSHSSGYIWHLNIQNICRSFIAGYVLIEVHLDISFVILKIHFLQVLTANVDEMAVHNFLNFNLYLKLIFVRSFFCFRKVHQADDTAMI